MLMESSFSSVGDAGANPTRRRALKQLRKIEARAGKQIRAAVTEELADLTKARNVKVFTKHEYPYRLRVGSCRVFFEFDGTVSIITIEQVRKRDERTY